MQCTRCNHSIESGEERNHFGDVLCEDCYMDALSPTRFCDPWAAHSAKSFKESGGENPVNRNQASILRELKASGGLEPIELMEKLKDQISAADGERECAALLRMEKIKIESINGKTMIQLS